jgi:predicted ATP-grasp superfamily ATP-dependent carboligase
VRPFAAHLEGCAGRLPARGSAPPTARAAGKAVVFARADVRVPDTRDWPARGIRDVPHPGEPIAAGTRSARSPRRAVAGRVLADLEARAARCAQLHDRVRVDAVA